MTFKETDSLVEQWFKDRGIYNSTSPSKQCEKLASEFAELCVSVGDSGLYCDPPCVYVDEIEDALGDMLVVMHGIASMCSLNLESCYEVAYNQIKNRKGKMIDGKFVKETDYNG